MKFYEKLRLHIFGFYGNIADIFPFWTNRIQNSYTTIDKLYKMIQIALYLIIGQRLE